MNQHDKNHGHHHEHQKGHSAPRRRFRQHHFVMVCGVVLMLVAMVVYVLSLDESVEPGGGMQNPVPADAAAE